MPEMEQFEISLDDMIMSQFEKGNLLTPWDINKDKEDVIHYKIRDARKLVQEVYKLYSSKKKPTKKDFSKLWDKAMGDSSKDINHFLDQLDRPQPLLRVISKKETDKELVIRFKKLDDSERLKIVSSIAKMLSTKLSKKDVTSLLEEGFVKKQILIS